MSRIPPDPLQSPDGLCDRERIMTGNHRQGMSASAPRPGGHRHVSTPARALARSSCFLLSPDDRMVDLVIRCCLHLLGHALSGSRCAGRTAESLLRGNASFGCGGDELQRWQGNSLNSERPHRRPGHGQLPAVRTPRWPRGELRGAAGAWQTLLSGGGLLRCVGDELGRWQGDFPDLARPSHQDRLKQYRGGHRA